MDKSKSMGKKMSQSKKLAPLNAEPAKKFTKKDLVEACRKQAPAFDATAVLLRRKMRASSVTPGVRAEDPDVGSQVTVMDNGVKTNAKKYNEYKLIGDRLVNEYNAKLDELQDLKRDEDGLDEMINCTNPESKRIRELLQEIEGVNKSTEKKLHYRLQLNHMQARLQKNSVTLDAHINAMEDTYAGSQKETLVCENLMRQVEAGRTKSLRDYEATLDSVTIERNDRTRIMSSKRNEAANASKMEKWRNDTEKARQELAQSLKGDLNKEDEERLIVMFNQRSSDQAGQAAEIDKLNKVLGKMEEAFEEIKGITGVNSLNEMVDKFSNHQEHRDRLLAEKKDAEDRLAAAKKALESAREKFNTVKEEGFGDTEFNREIRNEISEQINKEKTEGKVVRATCERLEKVLVGLRQGGMGLYQRLVAYHPTLVDGEVPTLNESATTSAIEAAYDTLKMLGLTETVLGKMLDVIGGGEGSPSRFNMLPSDDDGLDEDATIVTHESEESVEMVENPNLGEQNCRINPNKHLEVDAEPLEGEDGEEKVDSFDDLEVDDDEAVRDTVPTRTILKKSSEKQASKARQDAEQESRRKKIQEKLDAADEKERTALTSSAAQQKQQALANSRLAQHHHPVGLPKSLTVRDDAMTKAMVFMTEMPALD
ncbi:hypothetical protein TeGR_g14242 [Tetraparma gracilis]|uniref:Uncharacterized protein n=1 Tax=Tetraparma gracilis TaxID=2962635 RepID=A0ABQ6MKS8_9STRA|nr:hypothetical protein TeGR_g14242 [Tetraparma gracilis]